MATVTTLNRTQSVSVASEEHRPMFWHRPKPPYSQLEVAEQLGNIMHLSKLRDAATQKAILYASDGGSDVRQQRYLEQADSFDEAIAIAVEVLKFMTDEVVGYNKEMKAKRAGK